MKEKFHAEGELEAEDKVWELLSSPELMHRKLEHPEKHPALTELEQLRRLVLPDTAYPKWGPATGGGYPEDFPDRHTHPFVSYDEAKKFIEQYKWEFTPENYDAIMKFLEENRTKQFDQMWLRDVEFNGRLPDATWKKFYTGEFRDYPRDVARYRASNDVDEAVYPKPAPKPKRYRGYDIVSVASQPEYRFLKLPITNEQKDSIQKVLHLSEDHYITEDGQLYVCVVHDKIGELTVEHLNSDAWIGILKQ